MNHGGNDHDDIHVNFTSELVPLVACNQLIGTVPFGTSQGQTNRDGADGCAMIVALVVAQHMIVDTDMFDAVVVDIIDDVGPQLLSTFRSDRYPCRGLLTLTPIEAQECLSENGRWVGCAAAVSK